MNLSPLPIQKFFGNDGKPLVSGRLFTYTAGTSTKVATYVDSDGSPSNTNPIVFDFRGECRIWINPQLAYKFILAPPGVDDPPTNPIWTVDNITAGPAPFDLSATDTGPTNSIQLAIPLLASPEAFTRIVFRMNHTNTGAVTIAVNGGSALPLISQASAALVAGDLKLGGIYSAVFDGANWQLQDLSQAIVPVWTQKHTFAKVGTVTDPTLILSSALPLMTINESDQADREWVQQATGGLLAFTLSNNAHNVTDDWCIIQGGVGAAISSVSFPKAATRAHRIGTTGGPTNFNSINLTLAAASQHGSQLITSTVNFAPLIAWNQATAGDNLFVVFETEGSGAATDRGTITYNRGAGLTAYNTTSDGRRKKNIENSLDAGLIIDRIKVRQFDWKDSGNHVDYWLVAQELYEVAPIAVTKGDDDEEVKQAWSVDPSKLVPLLVKEIQSLRARMALIEGKKA